MHAHDRTMLARLGFADPDKSDSRHDRACQYLSMPSTIHRIVHLLDLEKDPAAYQWKDSRSEETGTEHRSLARFRVTCEYPIVKGSDQYRTSIGFADLVYGFDILTERIGRTERDFEPHTKTWGPSRELPDSCHHERVDVGVEVKISPVAIGDVIRQIKLYQTYTDDWTRGVSSWNRTAIHWVVATAYPVPALDVQSLGNERILHLLLGRGFREFADAQAQASAADNVEI